MCRGTRYAYVPSPHDAPLARIERELEFSFEHDTILDGHGAVERGLEARAKVYDANDGAVLNELAWLYVVQNTQNVSTVIYIRSRWSVGSVY